MYCRNCGKEIDEKAVVCVGCGVPPKKGKQFCGSCGKETNEAAEVCVSCGVRLSGIGHVGNLNIPSVDQIDYKKIQKNYGKHIIIVTALIVCVVLMSNGVSCIWYMPVAGIAYGLIRLLFPPQKQE